MACTHEKDDKNETCALKTGVLVDLTGLKAEGDKLVATAWLRNAQGTGVAAIALSAARAETPSALAASPRVTLGPWRG